MMFSDCCSKESKNRTSLGIRLVRLNMELLRSVARRPENRRPSRSDSHLEGGRNRRHMPAQDPHGDAPSGRQLARTGQDLSLSLQEGMKAVAELPRGNLPGQEMEGPQDIKPAEEPRPLGGDGGGSQMHDVEELQDSVFSFRRYARGGKIVPLGSPLCYPPGATYSP